MTHSITLDAILGITPVCRVCAGKPLPMEQHTSALGTVSHVFPSCEKCGGDTRRQSQPCTVRDILKLLPAHWAEEEAAALTSK